MCVRGTDKMSRFQRDSSSINKKFILRSHIAESISLSCLFILKMYRLGLE